ncbi:hypothetical protein O3G_MSEX004222 [Manduca sexta]|uniref:Uncharacterized protein n=1 Tax=Manduca sexta TaxID=7130 RepID=A0A921YVZ2_MANSE|nr:hypothetical protein O3G_MSEX004222 [Manduca sexta]
MVSARDKKNLYQELSGYVNVCAAVCLLLLVGGLSPQSSAAPGRSRAVMSRQRRAVGVSNEDSWLSNPCDYADPNAKPHVPDPKQLAKDLVWQARDAYSSAAKYKDTFVCKLYSHQTFDEFMSSTPSAGEWLRTFELPEKVYPKEKVLNKDMPDEYIEELMSDIDKLLPFMHKALKLIVAGLRSFSTEGLNAELISEESLKVDINNTTSAVRAVLCSFHAIMYKRDLEILPLLESEVPKFNQSTLLRDGFPLYRDTLNYLEYLRQVFQKLYGVA